MYSIRQYGFGPAENLRHEKADDPEPGPGQVRIRVGAAGVHLVDTAIRAGVGGGPFPLPTLPMTPGREVAGRVDAVGDGADGAWLGRRVVAHLGQASGGYARLAVAPVTALHTLPDGLGDAEAVAMIGTGRTAVAILEIAALTPDDVVLVTAAAGGIGGLVVQAARDVGAVVVGVAGGPAKAARVRELGVTAAVDYRVADWPEQVRTVLGGAAPTVVLEGVGGELGRAAGAGFSARGWADWRGQGFRSHGGTSWQRFARYRSPTAPSNSAGPSIWNAPWRGCCRGGCRRGRRRSSRTTSWRR
jgi:NADPH2:quinone reductase